MQESVYLRYQERYGQPSDRRQFEAALRSLDRSVMLHLISTISFSLLPPGHTDLSDEAQNEAIQLLFPSQEASEILSRGQAVFHRHQLLFMAQEVIKHCPQLCQSQREAMRMDQLGRVFLMASDHLHCAVPSSGSSEDELLQLILEFVPVSEANLLTSGILKIARSHLMVTRFAEARRGTRSFFDLPPLFHEATGIQFRTFEALMMGLFGNFINLKPLIKDPEHFGIPVAHFDRVPLEKSEILAFFKLLGATPEEHGARLRELALKPNDFLVIRDKPFVQVGEHYLPLDSNSMVEKFETGVYWSIFDHLPTDLKKTFPSFWGAIFEDYVLWLLSGSFAPTLNRLHRNPKFAHDPHQEVCDAIVVCDQTAIFMEIKGSTITSDAKYGSNVEKLRDELEKKYVGTKGVRQLANAIESTCGEKPLAIDGLDLSSISTVIPLLVTRDEIGGYFGTNAYVNARFEEMMGTVGCTKSVKACLCICSDTLEKLTPYFCDTSLADILLSRLENDDTLRAPFFARLGSILQDKNADGVDRQPSLLKEATLAVTSVAKEVFGATPRLHR